MSGPRFIGYDEVRRIHADQLHRYGGADGVRDDNGLRAAIAAPKNTWSYAYIEDVFELAACYAFHITKAHAFVDGNKRTALVVALLFIEANGYDYPLDQDDLETEIQGLSDGSYSEEQLAERFRELCFEAED